MTCTILSVSVDTLTRDEIQEKIEKYIVSGSSCHIITANSIMIKKAYRNTDLQQAFDQADLVVADSIGVIWAARVLGEKLPVLYPGIDLMDYCFSYADKKNLPVYFLGGTQSTIEQAVVNAKKKYLSMPVAGFRHGYFVSCETDSIIEHIKSTSPKFVFVGLDSPRQEIWISKIRSQLPGAVIMGIGGSFDVLSGRLRRAPFLIRRIGLEWVFRTIQQPWRLWRIKQLPLFAFLVIKQKLKSIKNS